MVHDLVTSWGTLNQAEPTSFGASSVRRRAPGLLGTFGVQVASPESMVLPFTEIEQPAPGHKSLELKPDGKFGTWARTGETPTTAIKPIIAATMANLDVTTFILSPFKLLAGFPALLELARRR